MNAMKAAGAAVLMFGLMFLVGGGVYGLGTVKVAPNADSCGNGFGYKDSFDLTDAGSETCQQEQSSRQATTRALFAAGIVGVIGSGILFMSSSSSEGRARRSSPPPPGTGDGLYGRKD